MAGGALDLEVPGVEDQLDAAEVALGDEHVEDVAGAAIAEELAKGFLVPWDPIAVDELDEVAWREGGESGFGEVRIPGEEVCGRAVQVCKVRAAAAGDEDFSAGLAVVLEERDASATPACLRGAEESCSASA